MFYIKDSNSITIYLDDGTVAIFKDTDKNYSKVIKNAESGNFVEITSDNKILKADSIKVVKDTLIVDNKIINDEDSELAKFVKLLEAKGITNIQDMIPFLTNIVENPYIKASVELYDYCKAMDFEITTDGCFLAYKKVRSDLSSVTANKNGKHLLHYADTYVEETDIDTNRHNVCSKGLHFCSKSYLRSFNGDKTIVVKVNPKDVVAIPTDYNFAKGRCTKYYVVGELHESGELKKSVPRDKENTVLVDRIEQTNNLMLEYNNDVNKVAELMNISVETVKRNMRKFRQRNK